MIVRTRYKTEFANMKSKLYLMLRKVERSIDLSLTALVEKDTELAREVSNADAEINTLEREIEHDCLKLLLLEHPVAGDFRVVSSALKVITDLERVGDQTRDLCRLILEFGDEEYIKELVHLPQMGQIAAQMVKDSVQAYINGDLKLANGLDRHDDRVDELFVTIKRDLVEMIKKDPSNADQAILLIMIAKYFERIADHAVNIGEWAIYSITGKLKGDVI